MNLMIVFMIIVQYNLFSCYHHLCTPEFSLQPTETQWDKKTPQLFQCVSCLCLLSMCHLFELLDMKVLSQSQQDYYAGHELWCS